MDRGLKHMLWMSWNMRGRALCINYIPNKITMAISHNYWNTNKDISWSEKLNPVKKLIQNSESYSPKDCTQILDTINDNCQNMDLKDTLDTLTMLAKIVREDKIKIDFSYHQGFKILCDNLKRHIRVITLPEVMESLKLLTLFGVPASTVLMQSLLQIVRNNINQLQIDQMHLLMSLLKKMEPTPLSSALLIALPILLPNFINNKLDHANIHELSLALFHLKDRGTNDELVKLCISIQSAIRSNFKDSYIYDVYKIFNSLCLISHVNYNSKVITHTISLVREVIFHRINKLNLPDIIACIKAISYSVTHGFMAPYKPIFINLLLEVMMTKNISLYTGCKILQDLNNMKYVYKPFIEYLVQKDLDHISEDTYNKHLTILLHALSNADYTSAPWECIENKICDPQNLNSLSIENAINLSIYLASLDKYYPQLLSAVFRKSESFLPERVSSRRKLLILHQSVKALYPEYEGPWLSENTLNKLYSTLTSKSVTSALQSQLEVAMGGPQYVLSSVKTKLGHFIDYAIIMRKDGHAIAFNNLDSDVLANFNNYIEDLQCPPESYTILIIEMPNVAYSVNTHHLLNTWKLKLKSIEKWTGHKCIEINVNDWEALPTHKKVLYFMEKIKSGYSDIVTET